jgi:signal transduction histidine kinase
VVGSQLFRIAQEALANVRKHARAGRAWASIRHPQPAVLVLEIGDDGVGFDPERVPRGTASAFGLASMRERAEVLGGTFRVDSAPGAGTRITVRVPLDSGAIEREEARGDALASAAG